MRPRSGTDLGDGLRPIRDAGLRARSCGQTDLDLMACMEIHLTRLPLPILQANCAAS